jgi:hypothetical protein
LTKSKWVEQKAVLKTYGHAAICIGSDLWVFGGLDDEKWNGMTRVDLEYGEVVSIEGSHCIPSRYQHAMISSSEYLWIFGGRNQDDFLTDLWTFDTSNYSFTCISYDPSPILSEFHPKSVLDGDSVIFSNGVILVIDPEKKEVRSVIKSSTIGTNTLVLLKDETILLLGGRNPTSREYHPFLREIND